MKKIMIIWLSLFLLNSCSNSLEKSDCNSQNWQDYGQGLALKGEELSEDKYYKNCIELEVGVNTTMAELGFDQGRKIYCTADSVSQLADKGQFFNFDFCQFANEVKMRVLHSRGVETYCTNESAYQLGLKGKFYNQICPSQQEAQFGKNFYRGRRERLFSEVKNKQFEMEKLDLEISSLRLQQGQVTRDLLALPAVIPSNDSKLDLASYLPKRKGSLESKRNELSQNLHQLQNNILKLKKQKIELQAEVKIIEKEILSLKYK